LLQYQVQELAELNLVDNETKQLDKEYKQLSQAENIQHYCQQALDTITNNEQSSLLQQLNQLSQWLKPLETLHPQLSNACELLNQATIYCQEASYEISHCANQIILDPQRLHDIEQRLTTIHDIARKHHVQTDTLAQLHASLANELNQLMNNKEHIEQMHLHIQQLEEQYQVAAKKLYNSRYKTAQRLEKLVTAKLQKLGMPGGKFVIQFTEHTDQKPRASGNEKIEFLVNTNPGQSLQKLAKIASGGELSRISLAINVLTAQHSQIPTLLFDEVDVGIGGSIAAIVGQHLRQLGDQKQILCVTHLPQVAAYGHQHLQANKQKSRHSTKAQLTLLNQSSKIEEIARMLGGVTITPQTLAHAEEMLNYQE